MGITFEPRGGFESEKKRFRGERERKIVYLVVGMSREGKNWVASGRTGLANKNGSI